MAVKKLSQLGTVHVVPLEQPASEDLDNLRREQEKLVRVLSSLRSFEEENKGKAAVADDRESSVILNDAYSTIEAYAHGEEELSQAKKSCAQLEPWGGFSRKSLESFEARGIHVALCAAPSSRLPEMTENSAMKVISESNGTSYFAVFSKEPLDGLNLPMAVLPQNTNLQEWKDNIEKIEAQQQERRAHLAELALNSKSNLEGLTVTLEERVAFAKARDGMSSSKILSFLRGYVPADHVDKLRLAARENGWAIRYEDVPDDDTSVPTHLTIKPCFRMAQSIFDFVGILPGYREVDVSVSMLIFLSIFCGMLVGDAGYGLLFTLAVLYFRRKIKEPGKLQSMNLLLIMSICILVYGALCGNWFAIPVKYMPFPLSGIPWLSDNAVGQKHVQLVCFFLGAFHMSLARAWRAILAARQINLRKDDTKAFFKRIREAFGHIGWGLFLWANFGMTKLLIVEGKGVGELGTPFVWLYIVGFAVILAFGVDWSDMGTVIYMPFSFINSFVDVLSYIRLFAVGLSSMYIADSFNGMATDMYKLSPWMIPAGLIVLALGHLLNIALACMGVLVHGIRLNTLEFSGHMDLSWSGKAYKPLTSSGDGK